MALLPIVAALALAGDQPSALPAPITPAAEGKAECFSPDIARKVCNSMSAFALGSDGKIANTATALLIRSPVVIMTTVSPVAITGGRVCGVTRQADLDGANFTIDGAPPDDAKAGQLHAAVTRAFAGVIDHPLCVGFEADGSQFVAHSTLDGLPRPDLDQRMMWVTPADGWKVAP